LNFIVFQQTLFTMRLQEDIFQNNKKLNNSQHNFRNLLKSTNGFIQNYNAASNEKYPSLIRSFMEDYKYTVRVFRNKVLEDSLNTLVTSLDSNNIATVQGAHLKFLQSVINTPSVTIPPIVIRPL